MDNQDSIMYDEGFKSIFAYKVMLAITLKSLIPEYADSSLEDIRDKYIQGDLETEVHSDKIDTSGAVEDGHVRYDVKFDALLPNATDKHMKVIINIEGQKNTSSLPYRIVTRGIYYACNMVASEYGDYFKNSHYENLEKVYSIWISMSPNEKEKGSIIRYRMSEENSFNDFREKKENYDKLEVVLFNLGPIDDNSNINYNEEKIMKTLTEIFSEHSNKNDAITLMEKEYQTEFPESMKKEMVNVCNWNEVFEERGMIKGRQEGVEQNKIDNALRMIAGGKLTYEEIASYTDLPLEKVQELAAKKSA
ncbi:hypothetical protein SAMN05216413_1596 [Ruminococcaceae bacterium KH2T8]|nr:hypothetical protein SAMN05216413_1596 [Ruminococcaceae bacterium KH2T8]